MIGKWPKLVAHVGSPVLNPIKKKPVKRNADVVYGKSRTFYYTFQISDHHRQS